MCDCSDDLCGLCSAEGFADCDCIPGQHDVGSLG